MATLATQKINMTLPGDVSKFLNKRAKRNNMSLPETILAIVMDTMEDEDDEISPEEDEYLGRLAEEAEKKCSERFTMEEVWKRVNAL